MAIEPARLYFRAQLGEKLLLPNIWTLMFSQKARTSPREGVRDPAEGIGIEAGHIMR
jgi:hypothetical protein